MPTRNQVLAWIALLTLSLLLSLREFQTFQIGTYLDDSSYVVLAQSFLTSEHYGLVNVPGPAAPTRYPFGFPMLLSPFLLLPGGGLTAMKGLSLVATLVNIALLFWAWPWLSPARSRWWGVAAAGLYALSPLIIDHTRMIMSEPIFTTLALVAMVLTERMARGASVRGWPLLMSVVLFLVLFTRTVGIILVGTIFLYLLARRRRAAIRPLALTSAGIAVLLVAVVWLTPVSVGSVIPAKYLQSDQMVVIARLFGGARPAEARPEHLEVEQAPEPAVESEPDDSGFAGHLRYSVEQHLGRDFRQMVVPLGGGDREAAVAERLGVGWLPLVIGYGVSLLIALGFVWWLWRDGITLFAAFAGLYLLALFAWVWEGPRLLYPVQPQLALALLFGGEAVALGVAALLRLPGRPARRLAVAVPAALALFLMGSSVYKSLQLKPTEYHVGSLASRTAWLVANTPRSAVALSEAPEVDYLYSGRRTVPFPFGCATPDALAAYARQWDATYVIVAPTIRWQSRYRALYSHGAACVMEAMESLAATEQVRLVHASADQTIMIFVLQPH